MEKSNYRNFYRKLYNEKEHFPWAGQIELTYFCNLSCLHCYCKGSENKEKELTTGEWKKLLNEIHKEGCLWLCFSGGDPLIREDFLDIYAYAKKKGFIITLFTNGQALTKEIIDYLVRFTPFAIEITLNGITKDTYESITQTPGSFPRVIKAIQELAEKKIKLILKANCLKQNKHEIGKIKAFTEELLGKPSENKYRFKYDPVIYPRLNGDIVPTNYRLSFEELLEVKWQDADLWEEYENGLHAQLHNLKRAKNFLYHCNSWMHQFFINPYGRLKFCNFFDKFSIDLRTTAFKEGFYNWPFQILNSRHKRDSKCRDCSLRLICYQCPGRAFLETGDEETPVEYFCQLAKETACQMEIAKVLKQDDSENPEENRVHNIIKEA